MDTAPFAEETTRCHFIHHNDVVATLNLPIRTYASAGKSRAAIWHRNAVFLCPVCGEAWGQRVYDNPPRKGWFFITRNCHSHGGGYFIETFYSDEAKSVLPGPSLWSFLAHELLAFSARRPFDYTLL